VHRPLNLRRKSRGVQENSRDKDEERGEAKRDRKPEAGVSSEVQGKGGVHKGGQRLPKTELGASKGKRTREKNVKREGRR